MKAIINKTKSAVVVTTASGEDIILKFSEYAGRVDKIVWVSDELGWPIDHPMTEQIDLMLWDETEKMKSPLQLSGRFVEITGAA